MVPLALDKYTLSRKLCQGKGLRVRNTQPFSSTSNRASTRQLRLVRNLDAVNINRAPGLTLALGAADDHTGHLTIEGLVIHPNRIHFSLVRSPR